MKKKQRIKKKCLIAKAARKDEGKAEKSIHTAFFSAGRRREIFLLILLDVCKSAVDSHDSEIKRTVDWINHWMQRQS